LAWKTDPQEAQTAMAAIVGDDAPAVEMMEKEDHMVPARKCWLEGHAYELVHVRQDRRETRQQMT
jgi:hypothetical protein